MTQIVFGPGPNIKVPGPDFRHHHLITTTAYRNANDFSCLFFTNESVPATMLAVLT